MGVCNSMEVDGSSGVVCMLSILGPGPGPILRRLSFSGLCAVGYYLVNVLWNRSSSTTRCSRDRRKREEEGGVTQLAVKKKERKKKKVGQKFDIQPHNYNN